MSETIETILTIAIPSAILLAPMGEVLGNVISDIRKYFIRRKE